MSQHFVFAGGGTGGHLYPGLAVAHEIRRLDPAAAITFLTTTRQLDRDLLSRTDFRQIEQAVQPFTLHPLRIPRFLLTWRSSVAAARALFRTHPPTAVLGLGGYAAGPGVVAAAKMGFATAILNPDAIPGRANRFLARRVDLVAMQWEASRRYLPEGARAEALGCPIRPEFSKPVVDATPASPGSDSRRVFDLAWNRPTLLVTGASQGARTVNEAVVAVWPEFHRQHPEWQLLHLTGKADEAFVRDAYERIKTPRDAVHVVAFTHEMWRAIGASDLVISRAGASTLAELTALGKPSILLPYPFHRDRHQHANAHVLTESGAAVLVEDTKDVALTAPALRAALEQGVDREVRGRMAAAAAKIGRPDASRKVAEWMLAAASRR